MCVLGVSQASMEFHGVSRGRVAWDFMVVSVDLRGVQWDFKGVLILQGVSGF